MAGVEPPDSPVWVAAEPDAPARVDEGEDAEAASPRDREDGAVLALGLGEDSDVASASGLETGAQALAPGAALPDWANDALSDGSSSDDEPECNICRLTAEEMGEPLIVVCSCTTMPVHLSCVEAWRVQCANPASARRCPTCHERYRLPASPRATSADADPFAEAGTSAEAQMAEDSNWSRLELIKRRLIFRAGGATWLPPEQFGRPAYTSARFNLFMLVLWILIAATSRMVESYSDDESYPDDPKIYHQVYRNAVCATIVFLVGYLGARFKNFGLLNCFSCIVAVAISLSLFGGALEMLLINIGIWRVSHGARVAVGGTNCLIVVTSVVSLCANHRLFNELDPRRARRRAREDRIRRRNERRAQQAAERAERAAEPAVAPPRGLVVGVVQQPIDLSLAQFLATVQMEAHCDTIVGMGVTTVEQLPTLDEQALVAQGMLPLQVRRLKRIAHEHLQQAERDRGVYGTVVGFTTGNQPHPSRGGTVESELSEGLLNDMV